MMWKLIALIILNLTSLLAYPTGGFAGDCYDFIIVGGGTGGAVLARRLSESKKYSVLVLEAGRIPHPGLEVPGTAVDYLNDLDYVRVYESKEKNANLAFDGVREYKVGRTLGGGSSVNGMVWNRGSPFDYDNWAKITGDEGWSYASLLPYFRRSENYTGDFPSDQHGYNGPTTLSRPNVLGLDEWRLAGIALGHTYGDPNGPQSIGFSPNEYSKRFGRRVSSFEGYLKPVLNSSRNLKVITGATVNKIMFNGNRVYGVRYRTATQNGFVRVRREVILAAGVIESPLLLMKSGIGPKNVLLEANILPLKFLPVGENLQDHIEVKLDFVLNDRSKVYDFVRDLTEENLRIYNETGEGPYSSFGGVTGQAFLATSKSEIDQWADIQLLSINSPGIPGLFPIQGEPINITENDGMTTCMVSLARPKSTGSIRLNATNLEGPPFLEFRYLEHPEDVEVLVEGIRMALKVFEETEPYQKLEARYGANPLIACSQFEFRSDDYWRCFVKQYTYSGLHGSGTCTMGSGPEDSKAVVDTKLKVIGFEGLRVADASVMPAITNANTQAAVYVIAEKAADMILKEWESRARRNSASIFLQYF